MIKINQLFIFLLSSFGSLSFALNVCEPGGVNLNHGEVFESSKALFEKMGTTSRLHIFGETHFYTNTEILQRLIHEITPSLPGRNKCIFFEMPLGGLNMMAEMIQTSLKDPRAVGDIRESMIGMSQYYPSMVVAAKSNGLQVFEIDHPDHFTSSKTLAERNQTMARNAVNILSDSTCDSAIFFVGKAHIAPLENDPSLVDLIRQAGMNPTTYNVADFGEESDVRLSAWGGGLTCSPKDSFPAAFSNKVISEQALLYPLFITERKPLWRDFDFSISR